MEVVKKSTKRVTTNTLHARCLNKALKHEKKRNYTVLPQDAALIRLTPVQTKTIHSDQIRDSKNEVKFEPYTVDEEQLAN